MATIKDRTTASQNGAVDETTPLIASESTLEAGQIENGEVDGQNSESNDSEKLPMVQIVLLCFARIAEPIAFFSVFTFIGQMIKDAAGVAEPEVGFYSGLIESIFSFVQMLLMIPWGRAADKFGRKPVLVISMAGLSTACALFGTSRSIWEMIMYRSIAGMFSGTVVAVRASISENSTPKTQARAFSYFAFSNNLGIFLGPFIGPVFCRPAEKYPSVFGGIQFFKDYPYALATFTTGGIGATACIVSALFVKETLRKRPKGDANGSSPNTMTTTEIMKAPGVSQVLFIYTFTMLLALAYTAIVPIFYFTSVELGGYGFSEFQIAMFIGVGGFAQALWLLFVFPWLQWRIGTGGVLRLCASVWPVWFAATPATNYLLRLSLDTAFWTFTPFLLVVGSGVAMAFKS
ncbi:Tetracycline resistance protein, TetA/multidrug resistance protein MdtG [Penicillium occitanis (nom. inval.)]|nr:Tetracycline resistance protein, TetA/multidrug resistance protein MdtG [Penicillium occitanis (nom. inval.)]